mgnify:CR=1 FL=1|tara:strand:- start:100 stop:393 length:294 start_codon:yes stop_codon:yes gene_type:complete
MAKTKTRITKTTGSLLDEEFRNLYWNEEAEHHLAGWKIEAVRYLFSIEAKDMGWHSRPIAMRLAKGKDRKWIFPMRDDEGNDGGALAVGDTDVLPVL